MDELSSILTAVTGASGTASFDPNDVKVPNALFVVARNESGQAVGCGAFRPLQEGVAEIKRMYARPGNVGVGTAVLAHLETEAARMGFQALWLETRLVNERAVAFYQSRGYTHIPHFGKYVGNETAVCFEKRLTGRSSKLFLASSEG
jgi:ribosomal protein S18 acetylase RimI-like enzyme